jgi:GR25 family glycosyltransferase involved in LPS biosynthesis
MTIIHYGVVAVPERRENAHRITSRLAATLTMDDDHTGHVETHRRAWANVPRWADAALILEDDAQICGAFERHIEQEFAALDDRQILSAYLGTSYPVQAQPEAIAAVTTNQPLVSRHAWHAVGLLIPAHMIEDMLSYTRGLYTLPWDEQVTHWIQARGYTCRYTLPSHANHADGPSILPATDWQPRDLPRRAHLMCGS